MLAEPLAVVAQIASAFDRLRVPYVIGGSLASSLYGVPRATQDADLIADLRDVHVDRFVAAIEATFFVDSQMIRSAIGDHGSFNVIHLQTMLKVDVFVPRADAWIVEELVRARVEIVDIAGIPTELRFASPEDTLLYKLVWYRLGGELSERQWNDVVGIIKIQGDRLDRRYIAQWSKHLKVEDLIARVLRQPQR